MKNRKYIHTQFIKFIVEKYNREKDKPTDKETNVPDEELIDDIEDLEKDEDNEDVEDLIAEYKDLYRKYDEKRNDTIYKRR